MLHFVFCLVFVSFMGVHAQAAPSQCDKPLPVSTYNTVLDTYKEDHGKLQAALPQWQGTATLLLYLTIAVAVCGACVAGLQTVSDCHWKKVALIGLGVLTAVVTIFKDNLPTGNYKTYQQAITKASNLDSDLNRFFRLANSPGLALADVKDFLGEICKKLDEWRELSALYSVTPPAFWPFSASLVVTSHASTKQPDWVSTMPQGSRIVAKGTGRSFSEAKGEAERQGLRRIAERIQHLVDASLRKPIYDTLKQDITDSLMKLVVLQRDVFFDENTPISYWILYDIDERRMEKLLSGFAFSFKIFRTNIIANKVEPLKQVMSDYGFIVAEEPAPRGPNSETNALFIGPGVPVDAVKALVRETIAQDIPLKGIVYPWDFQRSSLPQPQKLNHAQLGGTQSFESWLRLSPDDVSRLLELSSQEDVIAWCKRYTDKLREDFRLQN